MIHGNNYMTLIFCSKCCPKFPISVYQFEIKSHTNCFLLLTSVLDFQEAVKFTLVLSSGSVQSSGI